MMKDKIFRIITLTVTMSLMLFFARQWFGRDRSGSMASKTAPPQILKSTNQPSPTLVKTEVKNHQENVFKHFPQDKTYSMTPNFTLLIGVRALPNDLYRSEYGPSLSIDKSFTIFKPIQALTQTSWPVAIQRNTQKAFPISHILHLKNIDEKLRVELKAAGLKEHFYHSRLKLLSIEATPQTVLDMYQQLKQKSLQVTLEVLKPGPVAN